MQQGFPTNSYNVMQQYIYNIYIYIIALKVGGLQCSGACLNRKKMVQGLASRMVPTSPPGSSDWTSGSQTDSNFRVHALRSFAHNTILGTPIACICTQ
jgi:hypothetical protein